MTTIRRCNQLSRQKSWTQTQVRKYAGKCRLFPLAKGNAYLQKAELDTREQEQKCQMHYRPQHDAKALTSNYHNFEDDPKQRVWSAEPL